jgi:Transglutaminase-like superfamily
MPDKMGRTVESIVDVSTEGRAKHPDVKPQEFKPLLSEYWFALRLGIWLCLLPILLRLRALPVILERFTSVRRQPNKRSPLEMDRAVQIVVRICRLGLFHLPLFPQACLRQSLALYRTLRRMGYSAEIHFGIRKDGKDLRGHSWVTLEGKPVADRTRTGLFAAVYSYPPISRAAISDDTSDLPQSMAMQTRR